MGRSLLLKNVSSMLNYSITLYRANYPETFLGLQQRLLECLAADVSLTLHLEKVKLPQILMCPAPIDLTESKNLFLETREYESVCVAYMKVCFNKTTHWTTTLLWWKENAHQKGDKKEPPSKEKENAPQVLAINSRPAARSKDMQKQRAGPHIQI